VLEFRKAVIGWTVYETIGRAVIATEALKHVKTGL